MPANRDLTGLQDLSGLLLARAEEPEWLDEGLGSPADVSANLAEMWRINRHLGGLRSLVCHIYPRLTRLRGTITLVDLGAGSAEMPAAIGRWMRRQGLRAHVIAVDRLARSLDAARARLGDGREVSLLRADALRLPLPAESVDIVISSLFLHHFTPAQVVELLRSAFGQARVSLVMSDLVRGWLPLFAFRLGAPVLARNFLTRHDGAISIRRAYRPAELRAMASAAGLPNPRVYLHWPWRMTLVADK